MKTEQEQIKAIKKIIDERVETNLGQVQGRHDNVIKTVYSWNCGVKSLNTRIDELIKEIQTQ